MTDLEKLTERVAALEKLCEQLAKELEAVQGAHSAAPKVQDVKDPLHPSKAGTPEYAQLLQKLRSVRPHEKGYADAQAQLRAAGAIS